MADTKKPSLTVLGGPMAGTRFVFDEGTPNISVGSDEACTFRLQLPGVSPSHARIVIEGGGATIHATGGEAGLHVNDNRVDQSGTTLRNGDIVWLGTPGDVDVVMLQCILPRVTAPAAPPPARPAPEPPPPEPAVVGESETVSLGPETFFEAETVVQPPPKAPEPAIPLEQEFIPAEEPVRSAEPPVPVSFDEQATQVEPPSTPAYFEEDTGQTVAEPPPFVVPEESSTVVIDAVEFSGETPGPTVVIPPEPEPTMALPPVAPEPTVVEPPRAPRKPEPPAAAPPPARARVPPRAPAAARPAPSPRPAPAPRARPQPPDRSTPSAPRPAATSGSGGRYAGIAVVLLLIAGGGGYAAWRFLLNQPSVPMVADGTPPAATPAPVRTPPRPVEPSPQAVEATPLPTPVASVAPTPPPAPPTPKASAAPTPSPSASPRTGTPAPTQATTPPAVSAEAQRAAQVSSLLGQADVALQARQYDQAVGQYDEVLRLDPQNGPATNGRASAVALRDASRKRFLPGRTVVKTEKASGGLAGFDSGDVALQKAPDFFGRIEFEMVPPAGIHPGDSYTLRFFLVNEGKKAIRIQGVTVNTSVNGAGAGSAVPSAVKEVATQQRAQVGEISGSWRDGTTSWSAEVLITANKGDSLKNQITWR